MDEPFGPEYIRPVQRDCPRCPCCTEALCARGRTRVSRCQGLTPVEHRATVADCPCSAETTRHTTAWRAAQVRVTRLARELPLVEEAETLLRDLADGRATAEPAAMFEQLMLRGLGTLVHGMQAITPLGHTYLAARDEERVPTVVQVLGVDMEARTAQVEVAAWRPGLVTVLLDHIVGDSGVPSDGLVGRSMEAEANVDAEDADHLVLTGWRSPQARPSRVEAGGDPDE